jgi:hypothetical protein
MIDVSKIMSEIEQEVHKKMNNPEYVKDIERLKKLSVDKNLSSSTSDLYSLTFLSRRMSLPRSTRSGFVSKILNVFIVKFYYVVAKILEPVLNTQEKFNRAILEELTEVKSKIGSKSNSDFPYAKYSEYILSNEDVDYSHYKGIIQDKKRILDLSAWNRNFLDFAKQNGAKELYGVDIGTVEYIDTDYEVRDMDSVEFMTGRSENEFDVITIFNRLGYYNLGYLSSIFSQIKRTLKEGGSLIVEDFVPNEFLKDNDNRVFDPIAEKTIMFLLEHYGFFNIEKININKDNKYAIRAQKA